MTLPLSIILIILALLLTGVWRKLRELQDEGATPCKTKGEFTFKVHP